MDKIEEYLNNKKVWVVKDNGWYYSVIEEVFETKEEAIKYWEKLTCEKYNKENYEQYIKSYRTGEGHWNYSICEYPIIKYLEDYKSIIENRVREEEVEKFKNLADNKIRYEAERECKTEMQKVISGMLYLLHENDLLPHLYDFYKDKKNFWEAIENCRK